MSDVRNPARARKLLFAATQLLALARELELDTEADQSTSANLEPSDVVLVELARQIYHARRERSMLDAWKDMFGEPAWDMLLDLFVASHEGRMVSVSSACIGADVPVTTALRWLRVLQDRGMIEREDDPIDQRRSFVRLTASAFSEINRYLRRIAAGHSAFVMLSPSDRRKEHQNAAMSEREVNDEDPRPEARAPP